MSKNEVVKASTSEVADLKKMFNAKLGLGAGDNIDNEDIILPKLQLVQALSQAVADKQAEAGVYFNTVDKVSLGDKVDIIVMSSVKLWQVFKEVKVKNQIKKEYVQTIDFIGNESLPIDEEINGEVIHRDKLLRFYVLLVNDLKDGIAFPHVVDFKRTSYNAGRELQSKFAKLRTVGLPSYAKVFTLGTKFVQDEYDYYVKTVSVGRNIQADELKQVENWIVELSKNKQKYKADESEELETSSNIVDAEVVSNAEVTAKF